MKFKAGDRVVGNQFSTGNWCGAKGTVTGYSATGAYVLVEYDEDAVYIHGDPILASYRKGGQPGWAGQYESSLDLLVDVVVRVDKEPALQDLADEYRKISERAYEIVSILREAGFAITRKFSNREDVVIKPGNTMAKLKEIIIEKVITETVTL